MQQLPGFVLRIDLVKVGEEFSIGEVLQSRSIISHHVGRPGNEIGVEAVTVLTLVQTGIVAKARSCSVATDSPFVQSGHSRGVVRAVGQGRVSYVMVFSHDRDLA